MLISACSERDGLHITSGQGVESEVIHAAFEQYTKDSPRWFASSAGDFSTIATTAATMDEHVSRDQLEDLGVLGALVALNLIFGYPTLPLNPLLLQFFINDCDIHSLTEKSVLKWFPGLKYILSTWIGMTPEEPLAVNIFGSHLATYHDLQVGLAVLPYHYSDLRYCLIGVDIFSKGRGNSSPYGIPDASQCGGRKVGC